jgi:hypothetical protein
MECAVLEEEPCSSANYKKTAISGEENCELLQTVKSEGEARNLKRYENFDHYIILSLERVSIQSGYVHPEAPEYR